MKKLFTSFLAAGTVASFAFCAQNEANTAAEETTTETEETTTETEETTTIVKGKVAQGTFKIGYVGSDTEYTSVLKEILTSYTQDTVDKNATGEEFFNLPSRLFLNSSDKYNAYIREDASYSDAIADLKQKIIDTTHTLKNNADIAFNSKKMVVANFANEDVDLSNVYTDQFVTAVFEELAANKAVNETTLHQAFVKHSTHLGGSVTLIEDGSTTKPTSGNISLIFEDHDGTDDVLTQSKSWETIQEEFKATVTESLDDKTKLASKNIDALFVHVTDEVENKSDVYKAVVEKKQFKATKLFFIGEESKAQNGASSKVFAGENVSTASFNKYAAAYIAGFQAAVGAIKFSGSEDVYEQTSVTFLIGSTSESTDKKKAFAFRRGVEAAAAHESYSNYLQVKFVSKTEDSSKSSKKLYREVSEWKAKDDSKSKLYEFSSSDTFSDADKRVVYIAGSTAGDWTGKNSETDVTNVSDETTWDTKTHKADDKGLIGALYNYSEGSDGDLYSSLTSKTFSRGVWIVLDKVDGVGSNISDGIDTDENKLNYKSESAAKAGFAAFERHDIKFYGSIGTEINGTKAYAKAVLKGLYMGGPSYMIGKHTIFGAGLDLSYVTVADLSTGQSKWTNEKSIWSASSGKDTAGKAEDRFKDSFAHATEKELIEEELVKTSPWLK